MIFCMFTADLQSIVEAVVDEQAQGQCYQLISGAKLLFYFAAFLVFEGETAGTGDLCSDHARYDALTSVASNPRCKELKPQSGHLMALWSGTFDHARDVGESTGRAPQLWVRNASEGSVHVVR